MQKTILKDTNLCFCDIRNAYIERKNSIHIDVWAALPTLRDFFFPKCPEIYWFQEKFWSFQKMFQSQFFFFYSFFFVVCFDVYWQRMIRISLFVHYCGIYGHCECDYIKDLWNFNLRHIHQEKFCFSWWQFCSSQNKISPF